MKFLLIFLLLHVSLLYAKTDKTVILKTKTGNIEGTLLFPDSIKIFPVALIIAGSGPTDRNGNNPSMTNNSLKMLAESLCKNGIASLRYDKRGIAKSQSAGLKEADLRFENYIDDASAWVYFLAKDKRFTQIIIIGHGEGSLIGMIAAQNKNVDKFISIAGMGESLDITIKKQLKAQPPIVLKEASSILNSLAAGKTVKNVPQILLSLFRPSVQPYMISCIKYKPQTEIAKLDKPILIAQGTTDIQVSLDDANKLSNANHRAKIVIIKGMNHIFKEAEMDRQKNIQTYLNPTLPIKPELVSEIVKFIKK